MARSAGHAYQAGVSTSGTSGLRAAGAGLANVARTGAAAAGERIAAGARSVGDRLRAAAAPSAPSASGAGAAASAAGAPAWAQRLQRRQQLAHGASTSAHVLRSAEHGGGGAGPSLHDPSER